MLPVELGGALLRVLAGHGLSVPTGWPTFFWLVGHFREIDPPTAIERKRKVDKAFYVNRFLMSEDFAALYHDYITTCFVEGRTAAHDARLRTSAEVQQDERGTEQWKPEWVDLFAPDSKDRVTEIDVGERCDALMKRFAAECGVRPSNDGPGVPSAGTAAPTRGSQDPP